MSSINIMRLEIQAVCELTMLSLANNTRCIKSALCDLNCINDFNMEATCIR